MCRFRSHSRRKQLECRDIREGRPSRTSVWFIRMGEINGNKCLRYRCAGRRPFPALTWRFSISPCDALNGAVSHMECPGNLPHAMTLARSSNTWASTATATRGLPNTFPAETGPRGASHGLVFLGSRFLPSQPGHSGIRQQVKFSVPESSV
jgi:hypothetical protein